jgi:hypothetical protein
MSARRPAIVCGTVHPTFSDEMTTGAVMPGLFPRNVTSWAWRLSQFRPPVTLGCARLPAGRRTSRCHVPIREDLEQSARQGRTSGQAPARAGATLIAPVVVAPPRRLLASPADRRRADPDVAARSPKVIEDESILIQLDNRNCTRAKPLLHTP